jgi:hypothetical protein
LITLHKKAESAAPLRVFRAAVRKMIAAGQFTDYDMSEMADDVIHFTSQRGTVVTGDLIFAVMGWAPACWCDSLF